MSDEPVESLDPDQIPCRRCHAAIGSPCRQPDGARAKEIHVVRRRDALAGKIPQLPAKSEPKGKSPATPAGRSKGGKASAQARARRKKELAAKFEEQRAKAEQDALDAEAEKLAKSAAQYAIDRSTLKALTLKNAVGTATRLGEAIEHLRRPKGYDDDGRPLTVKIEVFDPKTGLPVFDGQGERVLREEPEVVGWTAVGHVVELSKAAAQQLASVRLEEGKPTGIHEHQSSAAAEALGEHGIAELVEFAHDFYLKGDTP